MTDNIDKMSKKDLIKHINRLELDKGVAEVDAKYAAKVALELSQDKDFTKWMTTASRTEKRFAFLYAARVSHTVIFTGDDVLFGTWGDNDEGRGTYCNVDKYYKDPAQVVRTIKNTMTSKGFRYFETEYWNAGQAKGITVSILVKDGGNYRDVVERLTNPVGTSADGIDNATWAAINALADDRGIHPIELAIASQQEFTRRLNKATSSSSTDYC